MQISGSAENLFYSLTVKELSEDVPGIPWHNYIINKDPSAVSLHNQGRAYH
jgi:hypothetical protein